METIDGLPPTPVPETEEGKLPSGHIVYQADRIDTAARAQELGEIAHMVCEAVHDEQLRK